MNRWDWGYIVWAAWIGLFLALELPAAVGLTPWPTLSTVSWHAESDYKPLSTLLLGFLLGLCLHIVFRQNLALTTACGLGVAGMVQLLFH